MDFDFKKYTLITKHKDISQICQPLRAIGIDGFFFMRHFPDGKFIDLTTNIDWALIFLENYFSEKYDSASIKDHMLISKNISLWSLNRKNVIWEEGYKYFSVKDGISISHQYKEYKDTFCFYIKQENALNAETLINLIELLKNFCKYFTETAKEILSQSELKFETPQKYKNHVSPVSTESVSELFFKKTGYQYLSLHFDGFKKLSPQEIECIKYAAKGYSSIEIADKMELSKRTVESYIINARDKTGAKNLTQLVVNYHLLQDLIFQ